MLIIIVNNLIFLKDIICLKNLGTNIINNGDKIV